LDRTWDIKGEAPWLASYVPKSSDHVHVFPAEIAMPESQNVRLPNGFGGILTFDRGQRDIKGYPLAGEVADWPVKSLSIKTLDVRHMG
jgi:hypothetical protein